MAPGDIRAHDARTGGLRWSFPTMPYPGEPGYETWPPDAWKILGGANSWAGMSLDVKRRLVYAPTGSAAFDFYGGNRAGDNLCANSLLCLKAETGERVWHFQAVKHDVWDRDFQAPPNLITVLALAGPSMPSRRSASTGTFSCSSAKQANRCFLWRNRSRLPPGATSGQLR